MTMRGHQLALVLVLAAGCESGTGDSPSLPASPPPPAPEAPPEEIRLVPAGFGGPLFQPNNTLRLAPGAVLHLPVMTAFNDFTRDGQNPGLSIFVRTDAPPTVLSVSPQIWVAGRSEPGLVEVQALSDASSSEPPAVFRVWLEEDPAERWAPGWGLGLDTTPLRIGVVEPTAPTAPCKRLELTGRVAPGIKDGGTRAGLTFGPLADDFRSGTITLVTDHPGDVPEPAFPVPDALRGSGPRIGPGAGAVPPLPDKLRLRAQVAGNPRRLRADHVAGLVRRTPVARRSARMRSRGSLL